MRSAFSRSSASSKRASLFSASAPSVFDCVRVMRIIIARSHMKLNPIIFLQNRLTTEAKPCIVIYMTKRTTTKTKTDIYQKITDSIVAKLEAGTAPWTKPWATLLPMSLSSRKHYNGINVWLLSDGETPWWGTYKQISELGGQVRKGEKATLCVLMAYGKDKKDPEKTFPFMKQIPVFNMAQADWVDGRPAFTEKAETVVDQDVVSVVNGALSSYKSRPTVVHGGERAYYAPSLDRVAVPAVEAFANTGEYASTMFHELTHSTGHESRLARDGVTNTASFGSHTYGLEELVAEMGSALLCGRLGIESERTIDNSAAYLASWLKVIKGDKHMIGRAASQAQKACDLILGE